MASKKMTYICPGCCHTSKKGFGTSCPKCDYEVPDFRFPSIEELLEGKKEFLGNWNDVKLASFTKSIVDYLVNSKQIELKISFNESERI